MLRSGDLVDVFIAIRSRVGSDPDRTLSLMDEELENLLESAIESGDDVEEIVLSVIDNLIVFLHRQNIDNPKMKQ